MLRSFFSTLLLVLAACDTAPADPPSTNNGALHEGNFLYFCTSDADAYCADKPPTILPSSIALGADFGLRFDEAGSTLEVDPDAFDLGTDGAIHAKRTGYGAVVAHAANGDVIDFVNLRVHEIGSLAIRGIDAGTSLQPGDTRAVRGEALDGAGNVLAGTLAYDWETSNSDVITIEVRVDDRQHGGATLRAVHAGIAIVRVVSGSSLGSATIQVGGA